MLNNKTPFKTNKKCIIKNLQIQSENNLKDKKYNHDLFDNENKS